MSAAGMVNGQVRMSYTLHSGRYPGRRLRPLWGGAEHRNFYYNFGDGWGANVEVRVIDSRTKKRIERKNRGFAGYEWMIDSILEKGKIEMHEHDGF